MANIKSAAKRARQAVRLTARNRSTVTAIKSQLKKTRKSLTGTDQAVAKADVSMVSSTLDKAVKTGRIHKNAANRHKSRMAKALATQAKA